MAFAWPETQIIERLRDSKGRDEYLRQLRHLTISHSQKKGSKPKEFQSTETADQFFG
jgi:hypothetical protein